MTTTIKLSKDKKSLIHFVDGVEVCRKQLAYYAAIIDNSQEVEVEE